MNTLVCQECLEEFQAKRKDAKFCTPACRRASHRESVGNTITEARRNKEFFDLHMRMCETYYGLRPDQRQDYLQDLIEKAWGGDTMIRRILTNRVLLRPDYSETHLFYRGNPEWPTLAQEAHAYAKFNWDAGIVYVLDRPWLTPPSDLEIRLKSMTTEDYIKQAEKGGDNLWKMVGARFPEHTLKAFAHLLVNPPGRIIDDLQVERWGMQSHEAL